MESFPGYSLAALGLGLGASAAGGVGLTPGQETKMLRNRRQEPQEVAKKIKSRVQIIVIRMLLFI